MVFLLSLELCVPFFVQFSLCNSYFLLLCSSQDKCLDASQCYAVGTVLVESSCAFMRVYPCENFSEAFVITSICFLEGSADDAHLQC